MGEGGEGVGGKGGLNSLTRLNARDEGCRFSLQFYLGQKYNIVSQPIVFIY